MGNHGAEPGDGGEAAVLRCRYLVADAATVYEPGELVVQGGRVVAMAPCRGPSPRSGVLDAAILPGIVNAHAHLALPSLDQPGSKARHRTPPFHAWVRSVHEARSQDHAEAARERVESSLVEFAREGCFAVGEIDSTGSALDAYGAGRVHGRLYRELLGFHLAGVAATDAVGAWVRESACIPEPVRGLSPHAPYSVSADLFGAAVASGQPLQVHVAETEDEVEFLHHGRGPFRDLLEELGRWVPSFQPPKCSPVAYLSRLGVLGPGTTVVHAQHTFPGDVEALLAAGSPLVVCPRTIEYFGRTPPPVPAWLRAGLTVALGTDSRASVWGPYRMGQELRSARRLWPDLTPRELLTMATSAGAEALVRPGFGRLWVGGPADFIQLGLPSPSLGSLDAVLEAWFEGGLRMDRCVRNGRSVA